MYSIVSKEMKRMRKRKHFGFRTYVLTHRRRIVTLGTDAQTVKMRGNESISPHPHSPLSHLFVVDEMGTFLDE